MYHSTSQTLKSCGVSIVIVRQMPWKESGVITDEGGRLLIVKGTLGLQKVTLVNLYLPNEDQVNSLEVYLQTVQQHKEGILVLGGDLNMALDPMRNSSKGSTHLSYVKLRKAKKIIQELQLIDSWRTVHAQDRDYTFFLGKV